MEKNAKKKEKKHSTQKNLLHHISTMGALQNIIQTDLGSYIVGLQLSFFDYFWYLVMWPPSQYPTYDNSKEIAYSYESHNEIS